MPRGGLAQGGKFLFLVRFDLITIAAPEIMNVPFATLESERRPGFSGCELQRAENPGRRCTSGCARCAALPRRGVVSVHWVLFDWVLKMTDAHFVGERRNQGGESGKERDPR